MEIAGLVEPKTPEATRICREDLNGVIAAFVQDKRTAEHGLFDEETAPQELTQERMGKIVRDKYPELTPDEVEAVRQRAVAALNVVQEIKKRAGGEDGDPKPTKQAKGSWVEAGSDVGQKALVDGVSAERLSGDHVGRRIVGGGECAEPAEMLGRFVADKRHRRQVKAVADRRGDG